MIEWKMLPVEPRAYARRRLDRIHIDTRQQSYC